MDDSVHHNSSDRVVGLGITTGGGDVDLRGAGPEVSGSKVMVSTDSGSVEEGSVEAGCVEAGSVEADSVKAGSVNIGAGIAVPDLVQTETAILFYDGDCPFCSRAVVFLARRTSADELLFAPLSGETARRVLWVNEQKWKQGKPGEQEKPGDQEMSGDQRKQELKEKQEEESASGGIVPDSVLLLHGGQVYNKTRAVMLALSVSGTFKWLRRLMWLPWGLLDPVYNLVAANRHRFRLNMCYPGDRSRILS